jgi:hypothetical protein
MMPDDASSRPMIGKITSDDDHASLLSYHLTVINRASASVETAKGPVTEAKAKVSEAQEDLTKAFNAAKADLGRGYSRQYLQSLLDDGRKKTREQVEFERMRARDKVVLNQPVFGVQAELFPGDETPVEAKDGMSWTNEGFLRGLRGDLEELQKGDPPRFHQEIMQGFRAGQQVTSERFKRALDLIHAREQPDAGAEAKDLNAPEPGSPEAEDAERKSVSRAKESLAAMGKAAPEGEGASDGDDFEAPKAEIDAQKPRLAVVGKAGRTSGAASPAAA